MSLLVKNIFSGATVQDNGRPRLQKYGVTTSGAIDKLALEQGRALFKEKENTAAIEFSAVGGKFVVQDQSFFASTGAETIVRLNGTKIAQGQIFKAQTGDEIEIGTASNGFYSYLHVLGGFQTVSHLGSRSTNMQVGLGLALETGVILPYQTNLEFDLKRIKLSSYFNSDRIRILPGPQTDLFAKKVFQRFLDAEFEISSMRNRMGVKLKFQGQSFFSSNGLNVLSEAIELGDIQINGEGTPTVLLNDRQPTGGYPRISTIISADLHKFAQLAVNSKFKFVLVSRAEAIEALKELTDQINSLRAKVEFLNVNPRRISNLLNYSLVDGAIRGDEYDES